MIAKRLIVAAVGTIACLHIAHAAALTIEATGACLGALAPYTQAWGTAEPQALAIRVSDDRTEVNCRASAWTGSNSAVLSLYDVTLDVADLHVVAVRLRKAGGQWVDLR